MAYLTRVDPAANIHRFYKLELWPTLFGEIALVKEWGRIGSPGTVRSQTYEKIEAAREALAAAIARRHRRGYVWYS